MEKKISKFDSDIDVDVEWIDENNYDLDNSLEVEANAIIGLKLRRYMQYNGLTREELADRLYVSVEYVGAMLAGRGNIGIGDALRFGGELGITLIEMPVLEF